jgi:hypothetical protein
VATALFTALGGTKVPWKSLWNMGAAKLDIPLLIPPYSLSCSLACLFLFDPPVSQIRLLKRALLGLSQVAS